MNMRTAKRYRDHKLRDHPLYRVWNSMKSRCLCINNQSYNSYGGRGIKVCNEWKEQFISFYEWAINNGWEKGLLIDRENNDGNYNPDNCRFVDRKTSCNNTRRTMYINFEGVKYLAYELFEKLGIPKEDYTYLRSKIKMTNRKTGQNPMIIIKRFMKNSSKT